jgi:hypothetical protein
VGQHKLFQVMLEDPARGLQMQPVEKRTPKPVSKDMRNTDGYIFSFLLTKRKKADTDKVEIRPKKTDCHYSCEHDIKPELKKLAEPHRCLKNFFKHVSVLPIFL